MKKFTKIIILILTLFTLVTIYSYILVIDNLPSTITIFEGEEIKLNMLLGFKINKQELEKTIETSSNLENISIGSTNIKVSLLNKKVKDIKVDVLPKTKVIPVGSVAGVKLYTSGVLVVGMSEIEGIDEKIYKPYEKTEIKEGDTIISVNNVQINSTDDLITQVNNSNGNTLKLQYIHDEKTLECSIKPIKTSKTEYKLGLWVRDSAAGIRNSNIL